MEKNVKMGQKRITKAIEAAEYMRREFYGIEDHEELWAIYLNSDNVVKTTFRVTIGTLDSVQMDTRRIAKTALLWNVKGVIILHNHPSGNVKPGMSDIKETEKLKQALNLFDINLMDHIIMGDKSFFSFAEEKEIQFEH